MDDKDVTEIVHDGRVTRRRMLLGTAGAIGAAAFLAACGDDDDSGGSATTAGARRRRRPARRRRRPAAARRRRPAAARRPPRVAAAAARPTSPTLLGIDEASAGKGQTIELGAVLALTGTGSFYGKTMSRGLDLAAKHIEELGGPTFKYTYLDHKSGDAAAGVQAMAEIVSKKIQAKFASYADDLGAMLTSTAENKMFTLDGGGGTSIFGQGQPYFWGTRAITPNDPMPGLFKWTKETYPDAKTVGLVGWDIGEANNTIDQGRHPRQDQGRRLRVQRPLRARPRRRSGLLAGAAEGQGQRARHPARQHLRPGPRFVRQPGGHRRPQGAPDRLRVHARRRQRVEGHVRLRRLHVRLRLLRRRATRRARWPRSSSRTSTPTTARTPTSTPPTSTRTRS